MTRLNVLSLFAGIGGLELGLERAGMTVVGQVEIDPFCQRVLAKHWPEVPRHDDVRTAIEWWESEPRPRVDLVCGGFPCQPFSDAGIRQGIADERWGWPWMRDVIDAVRPRTVCAENLASLLRDTEAFSIILSDLSDLGFTVEWDVVSACAVGAPHVRRRLFIVAHTDSGDGHSRMGSVPAGQGTLPALDYRARAWRDSVDRSVETSRSDDRDLDGAAARMVAAGGNAVVPQVAEHVGRLIVATEREAAIA